MKRGLRLPTGVCEVWSGLGVQGLLHLAGQCLAAHCVSVMLIAREV